MPQPGLSVPGNLHVPCYVEEWVALLAACLAAGERNKTLSRE